MGVVAGTGDVAGSLTGAFLLLRSEKQEPKVAPRPAATADCVQQAANGDVRAFEELYSIHLPRVHSLVRRMTGGRDADELTQDIFVRVWQKLGSFRGDSAFATWLHRLAVNVVIERFRTDTARRQRLVDGEAIFESLSAPPRRRSKSCPTARARSSCSTMSRVTSTPKSRRSSGSPRARRRRNCIAPA